MSTEKRVGQVLRDLRGTVEAPGPIGELGLMVEDLAVTPAGRRRLVRIWLDRDLGGLEPDDDASVIEPLSLDEVAVATRAISAGLDASDALGEAPYVLEVGSAGVDRPLIEPRHFRRNVTRLVEISLTSEAAGEGHLGGTSGDPSRSLMGRLLAAGPHDVTLMPADTKKQPQTPLRIPYADIARAQVQVEFSHVITEEDS